MQIPREFKDSVKAFADPQAYSYQIPEDLSNIFRDLMSTIFLKFTLLGCALRTAKTDQRAKKPYPILFAICRTDTAIKVVP